MIMDAEESKKFRYENVIELAVVGVIVFIGFVSLFYSWIDSFFGVKVNIILLTVIGLVAAFLFVYVIKVFRDE